MGPAAPGGHRLYGELAPWWSLIAPPELYAAEVPHLLDALAAARGGRPPASLLVLGSGGGHLASHVPEGIDLVLVDRSPPMLEASRGLVPRARHVLADLRTLRLDRRFDAVLLYDVVMYLVGPGDLEAGLATVAAHLRPDGAALVVPDCTAETFHPGTAVSGSDGVDRAARLLEWVHDPDPHDGRYALDLVAVLREGDGPPRVVQERHELLLLDVPGWCAAFAAAGLEVVGGGPTAVPEVGPAFVLRPAPPDRHAKSTPHGARP